MMTIHRMNDTIPLSSREAIESGTTSKKERMNHTQLQIAESKES